MPNIKLMESGLPVAPLKIGALESCRELGEKVNDYIVQFRKSTMDKNTDSPLYYNYMRDNYLIDCPCPRFGSGEAKGLLTVNHGSLRPVTADSRWISFQY